MRTASANKSPPARCELGDGCYSERMASLRCALLVAALAACGGSGSANVEPAPPDAGSGSVRPQRSECALGDAKDCMALTTEEMSVGDEGPCLRIVYDNRCGQTVYTETRIEHTTKKRGNEWQSWTSTTLAGAQMDLAQCGATGRYTNIASLSDGKLTVLETQCPKVE